MSDQHLTAPDPDLAAKQRATPPGMAHWAGTGPVGTHCGGCKHFMMPKQARDPHKERQCGKYVSLMKAGGPRVPVLHIATRTASCKYYEERPKEEPAGVIVRAANGMER